MKKRLVRPTLVLVCVLMVALPLFAQRGKGGAGGGTGGGSTGCVIVETPRLSTPIVYIEPNAAVGVFDRITNCSSAKKRYTVIGSSISSCGEETTFATGIMSFGAGESKNISVGYPIAPDTCPGPMTVSISVYEGGTMLGKGSTGLTVQ